MKKTLFLLVLVFVLSFNLFCVGTVTGASPMTPQDVKFSEFQSKVDSARQGSGVGIGHMQFFIKGPFEVRRNPDVMLTQDMIKAKTVTGPDSNNPGQQISKTFVPDDVNDSVLDEWEKTAHVNWEATLEPYPFTSETYDPTGKKKKASNYWDIYEDYTTHKKFSFPLDAADTTVALNQLNAAKRVKLKNAAPGSSPYWIYKFGNKWYSYQQVKYQWEFTNYKQLGQAPNITYQPVNDAPTPKIYDSRTYDPLSKKIQGYTHVRVFDPGIRLLPTTPKELEWVFGKMQRIYYTLTYSYTEYNGIKAVKDPSGKTIGFEPIGPGTLNSNVTPKLYNVFDYRTGVKIPASAPDTLEVLGKMYGTSAKTGYAAVYVEDYLPPASKPQQTLVNNSANPKASASSKDPIFIGKDAGLSRQAGPSGKFSMVLQDNGISSNQASINYGIGHYDLYWLVNPSNPNPANDIPVAYLPAACSSIGPYQGNMSSKLGELPPIPKSKRLFLQGVAYNKLQGASIKIVEKDGELQATGIPLSNPQSGEKEIYGSGEVSIGNKEILFPKNHSSDSYDPPDENSTIEIQVSDCCANSTKAFDARVVYYDDIRPNIEVKVTVPVPVSEDKIEKKVFYRTVPNDHRATPWPANYSKDYWPYPYTKNRIGVSQYSELMQKPLESSDPVRKKDEVKYGIWINNDPVWKYDLTNKTGWYPDKDGNDFLSPIKFSEDLRVKLEILARDNIDGFVANPTNQNGDTKEEVYGISRMEIQILTPDGRNITKLVYQKDTIVLKRKDMLKGLQKGGWGQYSEYISIPESGYHIIDIKVWDGNENVCNEDDQYNEPDKGIAGNFRELQLPVYVKKTADSVNIGGMSD